MLLEAAPQIAAEVVAQAAQVDPVIFAYRGSNVGLAVHPTACHEGRWKASPPARDLSATVAVRAVASNAEIVATELCLLRAPVRCDGSRWFQRHVGWAPRGEVSTVTPLARV